MNAKQLTIKTITENNFVIGRSVKGKGLEILDDGICVFSSKSNLYSSYIEEDLKKIELIKEREDFEDLYVSQYRHMEIWHNLCTFETQHLPLEEFIKQYELSPESFTSFSINRKPKLLGYISISKYNSSKSSQIELCGDLIALTGYSVYGEHFEDGWDMEYDDSIKKFEKHHEGKYYDGDYTLEHGDKWCEDKGCTYLDGRLTNYNESVVCDLEDFDESSWLKEIDPKEAISVYHRKAKDWYVGYSINSQDMYIYYKENGYTYEKEECDDALIYFYTFKEEKETLEKVVSALKCIKEDIECKCFLENELEMDNSYSIINKKVVELLYEEYDIDDFKDVIREGFSYMYETKRTDLANLYNETISSMFQIDSKFRITTKKGDSFNHLALINRLGKRYGYELAKSQILQDGEASSFAIKKDEEEFHFDFMDVIVRDLNEDEFLKDFIQKALAAIEKRKLEKINNAELYEKASKVFVSISDSLKSGNCKIGTNAFISKHHIDVTKIGGIRGDYLLSLEKSNFTLRAVSYAIKNHFVA